MKTKLINKDASEKASLHFTKTMPEMNCSGRNLHLFQTEDGLVRETICRVFSEDNTYYDSRVSTLLAK